MTNYNALTDSDLREQLEWQGFFLRYNADDDLELVEFGGGGETGETFDSVEQAHRYIFTL